MSFLKKLFGEQQELPVHTDFQAGDVFASKWGKKYKPYKLIVFDRPTNTCHLIMYKDLSKIPKADQLDKLEVEAEHIPIDKDAFEHPVLIANHEITFDDLSGYIFYLVHQGSVETKVKYAQMFYKEALQLTDQKDLWGAMTRYGLATKLIPEFFEAFDNWAFCQMDLGNFEAAISCFESSLAVNPNALLPTFSIGECYFKLEDYAHAKTWFEKAIAIDPEHPKPKEYLEMTIDRLG